MSNEEYKKELISQLESSAQFLHNLAGRYMRDKRRTNDSRSTTKP